jgi:hypothetical protein
VNRFIVYIHHSELQVIAALSLIFRLYKSSQHPLRFFSACCIFSRSLATASNSVDSSASRSQVLSSQSPLQNSTLNWQLTTNWVAPIVFKITPLHGPRIKHSNYCCRGVFTAPLHGNGWWLDCFKGFAYQRVCTPQYSCNVSLPSMDLYYRVSLSGQLPCLCENFIICILLYILLEVFSLPSTQQLVNKIYKNNKYQLTNSLSRNYNKNSRKPLLYFTLAVHINYLDWPITTDSVRHK